MGNGNVKPRFAWSIPATEPSNLVAMRLLPGVEVLTAPPSVWLRATALEDETWEQIRRCPEADRYTVLDDGQLIPVGGTVPLGHLPQGDWQPLARRLAIVLPLNDEPTCLPPPPTLCLVRSPIEREATWLQTSWQAWSEYAATAPQIRLSRWAFVADRRGRVVVRGAPLPPLPGVHFVEQSGIAVPAGWEWSPNLPADVVREAFALATNESLVWTFENGGERIAGDDWVQASRSAVRLTAANLA